MYRTRNMEGNNAGSEQFVDRLRDLPVVNDTLGKLGALYTGTKEHNRLFRFTLSTAESGLGFVYNTAKPVVKKFEKPIETLNGIAVQQLGKLEQDYPIIAQPTEVVIKQTKDTCTAAVKPVADRVKPLTDTVGSVTKFGVDKINSAKTYTVGTIEGVANYGLTKVNDVKNYGVNKVVAASDVGSKQMSRMLENQASQLLIAQVELLMGVADVYVDKYLPPCSDEADGEKSTGKNKNTEETQQAAVINRAWSLGTKVRRRAYNKAAKELRDVRLRSAETLSRLSPIDLLEYARTNAGSVREKVHYVWDEINKPAEQVQREETESEKNSANLTVERRLIATARHVTLKIKAGASALNLSIETVPGPFRPMVLQALELAQNIFRTLLSQPSAGLSQTSEEEKVKKTSVPSIQAAPITSNSTPSPRKVSPTNNKDAELEKKNHEVKKTPETHNKSAAPAPAPAAPVAPVARAPEKKKEEVPERKLSSSSSEQQDEQTYAETQDQDDSPDSYE